jgi:putative transposase
VLVAIGVDADGHRQMLGVAEGQKEDLEGWRCFLRHLKDRGLAGVQLMISDACLGLVEAPAELFPEAEWHACAQDLGGPTTTANGRIGTMDQRSASGRSATF